MHPPYDMTQQEHRTLEGMEAKIDSFATNLARLESKVDSVSKDTQKIALLEERHSNHSQAVDRAFVAIASLTKKVEEGKDEYEAALKFERDKNEADHRKFYWWIAVAYGMLLMAGVIGETVGSYIVDTVKDTLRITAAHHANSAKSE